MRFTPSAEQRAFTASMHEMLRSADTPSVIRAWASGDHEPGLALWRRLAGVGLHGLLHDAGLPEVVLAFEVLGYHAVPGPLVESVAVLPVLLRDGPPEWLRGLASGELIGTLAAPPLLPYALDADAAGLCLHVDGPQLSEFDPGEPLTSVDPARRLSTVDRLRPLALRADPGAIDHGALAVAAQLLGVGRRLLDDTVAYAKHRQQYGRPIGQFQAVKHLLAEVVVGLELARPLVHAAALTETPRDISAARVACADAAYLSARTALQVHGAVGYTAEHNLGLWFTKVRALRSAWGSQAWHRDRVLQALVASS
ncbi:MAG: acyl-CoA dehydrogenase family protein [Thermocrispum sp.]